MTHDRPQNHFRVVLGFNAALRVCSTIVMNILISAHAVSAINSNYPFPINEYRIVGNFCGVQSSRMANLQSFCGLIFADASDHAHYTLHNRTYFAGLIFADSRLSAKTANIRPHENFSLYGNCHYYKVQL
jgi:hypothetical protein